MKLAASSNSGEVTSDAWTNLFLAVVILLGSVMVIEKTMTYLISSSPEFNHSTQESEKNRNQENSNEEE